MLYKELIIITLVIILLGYGKMFYSSLKRKQKEAILFLGTIMIIVSTALFTLIYTQLC